MKRTAGLIAISALFVHCLRAQDQKILIPTVGVEAGVPLNEMFSTYPVTPIGFPFSYTPFSSAVPSYQVGAYADFHLIKHLAFELDGLYRPGSFAFEQSFSQFYEHTHFDTWEFPFMFQYNFTKGRLRPFVDLGASFRHISGVHTTFDAAVASFPPENTSDFLRNWSSWGGVVGSGIAFKGGPIEFRPQFRYTRWVNQSFNSLGMTNSLNESVILLGIGF